MSDQTPPGDTPDRGTPPPSGDAPSTDDVAALRATAARYRALVESTGDVLWEVDAAGRYTYVSPNVTGILGYAPDALLGRTPFDLMPEAEARRVGTLFATFAAERQPFSLLVHTVCTKDERVRVFECSGRPVVTPDGALAGYRGVDRDITEREEAQRAWVEAQQRYFAVVQSATDAIVSTDAWGRVVAWNPAAERIFGYEADAIVGELVTCVIPPALHAAHTAGLHRLRRGGVPKLAGQVVEFEGVRRDGTTVPLELTLASWRANGKLFHTAILRDITARKAAVTEIRARTERLRRGEHLEALGRLSAGIAHDFNNALTGILGFAELGLRAADRPPDQQADLEQIRQAALRAASLTHQLLAFSRQQILEPSHVAVNDLVHQALPLLRRLVTGNVEIRTELGGDAGVVRVDPGQFTHVLINLAVNARDAMPTGGVLTISTAAVWDGSAAWAVLKVRDTGCGMAPEVAARAFEPFFSTKPAGRGTGLGLSSVYGTVVQSDGTVQLESAAGLGTTVTIRLPQSDRPASANLPPPPPTAAPELRGTVLLVEDEPVVRDLAQRVLRGLGLRVVVARDGAEGLIAARRPDADVDLLVTDLVMPRMNGWELAEQLRHLRPRLPVVFVTGHAESAVVDRVRSLRRSVLVRKPFGPEQLERAVRAAYGNGAGAPA